MSRQFRIANFRSGRSERYLFDFFYNRFRRRLTIRGFGSGINPTRWIQNHCFDSGHTLPDRISTVINSLLKYISCVTRRLVRVLGTLMLPEVG